MVLALVTIACLTKPRVRFGRSLDELNIRAPFPFARVLFRPMNETSRDTAPALLAKAKNTPRGRLSFRPRRWLWRINSPGGPGFRGESRRRLLR